MPFGPLGTCSFAKHNDHDRVNLWNNTSPSKSDRWHASVLPIHLQRKRQHVPLQSSLQIRFHILRPELEQLLDDVISKNIVLQIRHGGKNFVHDRPLLDGICDFQPLLDESRTVLIETKLDDVTFEAGDRRVVRRSVGE